LQDVDVNVERQKGKGVNVVAYMREVRGEAPLEIKQGDEEGLDNESDSNMVLSLLGMVQDKSDRVADNLAAAVAKDGGIGNFAKNTTSNVLTGVFEKVTNVVGLTGDVLKSNAKSLHEDVKKSGGIDKYVLNTTQNVATAVTDKASEGITSVKEKGISGAASFATDNVSSAVGTVASRANDALLQEALHRKVMGCYPENVAHKYVDLNLVKILRLHVDARKLFNSPEAEPSKGIFKASEASLREPDLVPHPKAKRTDGLPIPELRRRLQVTGTAQNTFYSKRTRSIIREHVL